MESNSPQSHSRNSTWWRLPLLLVLVLAAILLLRGRGNWNASSHPEDKPAKGAAGVRTNERVLLAINFGDNRRQDFGPLAWHEGMTVAEQLMTTPGIQVTQQGSGQSAFLTAINNIANEGADGNNWTYEVNEKSGDRSFAVYQLEAGDRVLWTFGQRR